MPVDATCKAPRPNGEVHPNFLGDFISGSKSPRRRRFGYLAGLPTALPSADGHDGSYVDRDAAQGAPQRFGGILFDRDKGRSGPQTNHALI